MRDEDQAVSEAVQASTGLTNGELIERLRTSATDCGQKSMTARLTAVINLVEALLTRGYDRSQVREWLIAAGWRFTTHSFDSALSRIRKRSVGTEGAVRRIADRPCNAQTSTPAHEAEVLMSTPKAADGRSPGSEPERSSFSDTFAGRQDFTAGRRWK